MKKSIAIFKKNMGKESAAGLLVMASSLLGILFVINQAHTSFSCINLELTSMEIFYNLCFFGGFYAVLIAPLSIVGLFELKLWNKRYKTFSSEEVIEYTSPPLPSPSRIIGEKHKVIVWFEDTVKDPDRSDTGVSVRGFPFEDFPFHEEVIEYQYYDNEMKFISGVLMMREEYSFEDVREEASRIGTVAWVRPYSIGWKRCTTINGEPAFQTPRISQAKDDNSKSCTP